MSDRPSWNERTRVLDPYSNHVENGTRDLAATAAATAHTAWESAIRAGRTATAAQLDARRARLHAAAATVVAGIACAVTVYETIWR